MVTAGEGYAAVVLAGGRGERLGGADKGAVELAGTTLLERALAAVAGAGATVVVGRPAPTSRPVTFVREEPAYGGPAAGLLAGRDAVGGSPAWLVVLAVDMPLVRPATVARLLASAAGHDGAFLTDARGRRQLAGVLRVAALDRVRPADAHGLPLHRLLAGLDLTTVSPHGEEGLDVDTWADVARLRDGPGTSG